MTLEQRVYDAERAKNILENEVFQQVFSDIETELVDKWKSSNNADAREKMHQYLQIMELVKAQLMATFESGKLATVELNYQKTLREKLTLKLSEWL
jgi:hypothetical protein